MLVELAAPARPTWAGRAAVRPARARRLAAGLTPYLYLLPALAGIAVWIYRPLVQTVQLSFYDWNLLPATPATPAGLSKYRQVLSLPEMGDALANTGWYILGLLPFSVVLPVLLALATQGVGGRARGVYRSLVFAPMLVAPVATAAVWRFLLNPQTGAVNSALETIGVHAPNWFRQPDTALIALIVITGWQMLGFSMLVVSAGLAGISDEYRQAAALDGASRGQITRLITLPLLSPTLLFMVLMTVLLSAQWTFPLIDLFTQGGPGDATTNVYYLLWQFGFRNFDTGTASAAGVLFFVGFGLVAAGFMWLLNRFSFYDD